MTSNAAAELQHRAKPRGTPWPKGVSGNPTGSKVNQRYQELHSRLLSELGGDLTAIESVLLDRAVKLLLRRPKSDADAVKITSESRRILEKLRADRAAKPAVDVDVAHLVTMR